MLAALASEALPSKKRPGRVNASPVDGSWRLDFAGAPHCEQYHRSYAERLNRQVLLHLPVSLSSRPARPTDDSQEHMTIGRRHIAGGWPWPRRAPRRRPSGRPERVRPSGDVVVLITPWLNHPRPEAGLRAKWRLAAGVPLASL